MLKLREEVLAQAGYRMILGANNENDGANFQKKVAVIQVDVNPTANETIGLGTKTYTFKAAITGVDQILIGTDEGATALNIIAKINADMLACGAEAFSLGGVTYVCLVSNTVGSNPTFTPDGVKVKVDTAWTLTVPESLLEDTGYFKKALTVVDAKPIVLVERNAGTAFNFLY